MTQRRLGGIIRPLPHNRHVSRHAADLHDAPARRPAKERHKGLAELHDGEDVDAEERFDLGDLQVQRGRRIMGACVVDEEVQPSARALGYGVFQLGDARGVAVGIAELER